MSGSTMLRPMIDCSSSGPLDCAIRSSSVCAGLVALACRNLGKRLADERGFRAEIGKDDAVRRRDVVEGELRVLAG